MSELHIDDSERTPCEIWTRVMGYHRPLMSYNIGKKQEFADRTYFNQKTAMKKIESNSMKLAAE